MSPEARQRALGRFVCRLVNAPARRNTLVLVVEDLHWMDEGSAAMLDELIDSIQGTKTLAIVNYRPEYAPPGDVDSAYRTIRPEPLTPRTPASCCETWPVRTPRWTDSRRCPTSVLCRCRRARKC